MKPALLEVMRMNRICRMVLATCLGSFILVIFYFQSMLHPGRGRVSVVLLNIFFSLSLCFLLLPTSPLPFGLSGLLAGCRDLRVTELGWEERRCASSSSQLQAGG